MDIFPFAFLVKVSQSMARGSSAFLLASFVGVFLSLGASPSSYLYAMSKPICFPQVSMVVLAFFPTILADSSFIICSRLGLLLHSLALCPDFPQLQRRLSLLRLSLSVLPPWFLLPFLKPPSLEGQPTFMASRSMGSPQFQEQLLFLNPKLYLSYELLPQHPPLLWQSSQISLSILITISTKSLYSFSLLLIIFSLTSILSLVQKIAFRVSSSQPSFATTC